MNFDFGADQDEEQGNENQDFNDADLDFFTEEEIKNGDFREVPDEVLFLIHITPSIFRQSDSGKTPILEALKGFSSYLKSKIISNSKDKVGLIFYNSPQTKNPLNFKYVEIFQDLAQPSAQSIKLAHELEEELENRMDLLNPDPNNEFDGDDCDFPSKTSLYEALWTCSHVFQQSNLKNQSSQRIFLFTSVDEPDKGKEDLQAQAIHHANRLSTEEVEIELFPLRSGSIIFNYNKFYKDIVNFEVDGDDADLVNYNQIGQNERLEQLHIRLRRKEFKKRQVGAVDFELGVGVKVGTKL